MIILRSRASVFADDSRMTSSNAKKGEAGTVGGHPILLPVAQRMDADPECLRKLVLREADESAERRYVARFQVTGDNALSLGSRECPSKLLAS